MSNKIVLAYSGGLDTSVILKWLVNKGHDVVCFVGNIGQQEDFAAIEKKALNTGASRVYIEDVREEFVNDFIFPAMRGNAMYEGRYLLGTSLARPLLAKKQVEIAEKEGTDYVAHGATGKGNDQVRFELSAMALNPHVKIISPWKDPEFLSEFKGRSDMIAYAAKYGIPVKAANGKSYSEDENLMHISHEAGVLENPAIRAPQDVFSRTVSPQDAPDIETVIDIHFKNGYPVQVENPANGTILAAPLHLFLYLNRLGSANGIGRLDMVENRFVGIKSRGVYETPGATILWAAHLDLEGIAMDREVKKLQDMLTPKFAELIYNGFWYSPEMDAILSFLDKSQEAVDGKVTASLYKGNVMSVSRESPTSLYNEKLSSMEVEGGFNAIDSRGFINTLGVRLKAHALVLKKDRPYAWRERKNGK